MRKKLSDKRRPPPKRGGTRPGAGRPRIYLDPVRYELRLPSALLARATDAATAQGISANRLLVAAIERGLR